VVDGRIPKLDMSFEPDVSKGFPACSLIVGIPPGPDSMYGTTWAVATNRAVLAISPMQILSDISEANIQTLTMPVPAGSTFTDMATLDDGTRVGSRKKKSGTEESFTYTTADIPEAIKSWRINFDRMLGFVVDRLRNPTDDRAVVWVAFNKKFMDEIAGCIGDGVFWLAIPAVKAQTGVYVSDSSPTIGGGENGQAFAISLPFLDKEFQFILAPGDGRLAKVLPRMRAKAAQITRFFRHLGSLIGKSVETDVPAGW